jgi:hypothetical protein
MYTAVTSRSKKHRGGEKRIVLPDKFVREESEWISFTLLYVEYFFGTVFQPTASAKKLIPKYPI